MFGERFSATTGKFAFTRRAVLGFHFTTFGKAALRHDRPAGAKGVCAARTALPKPSGAAALTALLASVLTAVLALGAVFAAGDAAAARGVNTWLAMFDLEPGVTYTYELTYQTTSRAPSYPWWMDWVEYGPGGSRNDRSRQERTTDVLTGRLNLWRTGGGNDQVRFWFAVDGVRVNGAAPVDPQAVAGAVLVAALTNPEPIPFEGVRLLATAFQWTNWRDLFEHSTFRNGTVWEVMEHPSYRFTASQAGYFGLYRGEVEHGRDTVMEIAIDLREPLPLEIVAFDGRDRYWAELVQEPVWGPRR